MLSVKNDNTKILQMKCKITFYEKKKENDRKKKNTTEYEVMHLYFFTK